MVRIPAMDRKKEPGSFLAKWIYKPRAIFQTQLCFMPKEWHNLQVKTIG
jgi:hypothetical protein